MNRKFNHVDLDRSFFGEIKQINEDGKRWYMADNKKYPSVTTVLGQINKKSVLEWRARVGEEEANKISRTAALRGTKFHTLVEKYLRNQEYEIESPLQKQMFMDSREYLNKIDNIHLLESRLYSDHLRMAGTVDCIAEFDGRLSVIDFKTSSRPKDKQYIESYFLQATAYSIMFEERTGIPVPRIAIIISVEGESAQVFTEKRDSYVQQLLHYRDAYEGKND
jgi:genome maintenance exonuclease 1